MPGRVKYIPNIVMDLDINPIVSYLDKSNNYMYDDAPFKISDHIILCSRYQSDKYMEQCHTYCPAVCFPISDLFDIELN